MNQSQVAAQFLNCKHFIGRLNLWPSSAMAARDASPPAKRRRRGVVPEKSPNEAWRFCQARCGELRWVEVSQVRQKGHIGQFFLPLSQERWVWRCIYTLRTCCVPVSFKLQCGQKSTKPPTGLTGLASDHHVEKHSKDKFSYRWMLGCNFPWGGLRCQSSCAKVGIPLSTIIQNVSTHSTLQGC